MHLWAQVGSFFRHTVDTRQTQLSKGAEADVTNGAFLPPTLKRIMLKEQQAESSQKQVGTKPSRLQGMSARFT